jgi:vacuolar-type H+-ATPase subunit H
MNNVNTLDNLLQIETRAVAIVKDAQAEAERRMQESEMKKHAVYEECFKVKVQKLETSLREEKEKIKIRYANELEQYCKEISVIDVNVERFSALLNNYLALKTGNS